jgi:altronate hydrolase
MQDDMDFDAGRVLDGTMSMQEAADELRDMIVSVASGQQSKPESLGHREYFVMYKHQDTPPLDVGCRA